jgi:Flp pilus assembly protein TadG
MGWISKLRRNRDRGANLVEFALIAPLLVLLLIGIVELGWGLAQHIDVRHKARETLRLAIVDEPLPEIEARACNDDIVKSGNIKNIALATSTTEGDPISVTITADLQMLTGLFTPFFGSNPQISSTVEGRVEQKSSFASQDLAPCP